MPVERVPVERVSVESVSVESVSVGSRRKENRRKEDRTDGQVLRLKRSPGRGRRKVALWHVSVVWDAVFGGFSVSVCFCAASRRWKDGQWSMCPVVEGK